MIPAAPTSLVSQPHALPLARVFGPVADAVQAVRSGTSLTEALTRCPDDARPATQALAFHVLRWLGAAETLRIALAPKPPPPAVDSLLLCALALLWPAGTPPYAEHTLVDQAVAAMRARSPRHASLLNAVLRRFLRERDALVEAALSEPLARFNHPAWWVERLQRDWPGSWQQILEADNRHPPMTLRVNARRSSAAAYVERLAEAGMAAHADEGHAVTLERPVPVGRLPGFAVGDVSVQDAAAQRAVRLLVDDIDADVPAGHVTSIDENRAESPSTTARTEITTTTTATTATANANESASANANANASASANANENADVAPATAPTATATPTPTVERPSAAARLRVLDACAAPGGKTAQWLELADVDLLALDSSASRLARVDDTLRRLGLRATTRLGDAGDPAAWWDGVPFDRILLDAPCSASGVVRRHPDVRWLRRATDIDALVRVQKRLLDALWALLRPGGRLLYCTCSVFRAEGEAQIAAFLQRNPNARVAATPHSPGHLLPLPDNRQALPDAGPHAVADGFFLALLEKT